MSSSHSAWAHLPTLDTVLSALPFPAMVLDAQAIITAVNARWAAGQRAQMLWGGSLGVGVNYAEMLGVASTTHPPAFAIRHAISVAQTTLAPQHVDYEQAGGEWRARVLPMRGAPGHALCWHEPLRLVPPRTLPIPKQTRAATPLVSVEDVTLSGAATGPAVRLNPAEEGRACLRTVLASLQVDVADPLLLLHQAHAGSLMLSGPRQPSPDHKGHGPAENLRQAIEEQLRASTAGIAVDWRPIREGIDACLQ